MGQIFFNGNIITMEDNQQQVEAVYVKDGKIAAVGSLDAINKYQTAETEMIDLDGNTMFPGFFEPHIHLDLAALIDSATYVGGIEYENTEDVLNVIKKTIEETPPGKWIFFFGLDYLINRDLPMIDRHYLDNLSAVHPMFILIQSMHTVYANSLALELVGIDKDTKDTRDGHCFKDENGVPTGVLTEQTFSLQFVAKWMQENQVSLKDLFVNKTEQLAKMGITTAWTAGLMPLVPNHNQFVYDIITDEKCPIRHDYAITFTNFNSGAESLDKLIPDHPKSKFTGVKLWLDGSPYTGNMKLFDNYLENEIMQERLFVPTNQNGELLFPLDTMYEIIKEYHNKGVQISVHSQGDRSGKELVDIFERVLTEYPRANHHHRIEHCAFLTKEDTQRCAQLGIELSYHVNHIYYYGEALNDLVVGPERARVAVNAKWGQESGANITLHSDDPMYHSNPLRLVCTAVTRQSRKGKVFGPEYKLTVDEAMKAITINSAKQLLRSEELGSIAVGKYADFTVLAENPYSVDPLHIGDIEVVKTYLDGKETHV